AEEPNKPEGLLLLAKLEWNDNHVDSTEALARKVLRNKPYDRRANLLLLQCAGRKGEQKEALEAQARGDAIEAELQRLDEVTRKIVSNPDNASLRWEAGALLICDGEVKGG